MSSFSNIINSEIEGECRVKSISPIRRNSSKMFLFLICSFLSLGLLPLLTHWFKKLKRCMLFVPSSLQDATHLFLINTDQTYRIVRIKPQKNPTYPYFFTNRHLKYLYSSQSQSFQASEFSSCERLTPSKILQSYSLGLPNLSQLSLHRDLYGKCVIEVPLPKLLPYLLTELTNPFFIIQYISCAIWIVEGFIIFAIILVAVSFALTLMNFVFLYIGKKKLKKLAEHQIMVSVLREGQQQEIQSWELVPGDVFIVRDRISIPCDCVLVSGDALMNESMLTGESVPTPKFPLEASNEQAFFFVSNKRNLLFEGTKVLQIKGNSVQALVLRTGFASIKGQLIRTILFPKFVEFGFNKQGIKCIISLAVVCFSLYFVTLAEMIKLNMGVRLYVLRFLDVVTWVIPPALPIFMTLTMTIAIIRLKFKGVIGLIPHGLLSAGKVDTCCFDKTGTITENGIDVNSIIEFDSNNFKVEEIYMKEGELPIKGDSISAKIMATCHSVYMVNNELIGDSLDISMLQCSHWKYEESKDPLVKFQAVLLENNNKNNNSNENTINGQIIDINSTNNPIINHNSFAKSMKLKVMKIFEFTSDLQRMSVIVQDLTSLKYYLFLKGSPEKTRSFSLKSTIPPDFTFILEGKSLKGFRILGLAYKELEKGDFLLPREELEKDLIFQGFLVLENKLKIDSQACLLRLNDSGLKLKLISGDNLLTTVQTAKEAGILSKEQDVLLCELDETNENQLTLKILKAGDEEPLPISSSSSRTPNNNYNLEEKHPLSPNSSSLERNNKLSVEMKPSISFSRKAFSKLKTLAFASNTEVLSHLEGILASQTSTYELALSGPAFKFFNSASEKDQNSSNSNELSLLKKVFENLLKHTKVFARMKPEQKTLSVILLQKLAHIVCMTGDGANDCGALKQADIGISFAETDASFSAPFTSSNSSINCVEKVLLEGRATIVNSVEVFRYYLTVSFLKFFGIWLLVFSASNLNDFQWSYINYLNSIISLSFVSFGAPLQRLSRERPPDNLIGLENLFSIYGTMFLGALGEGLCYIMLRNEEWFLEEAVLIEGDYRMTGPSNTTVFYSMNILYISALVTFIISKPFKQRLYKNYILSIWLCICFVYNSLLIFYPGIQIPTLFLVELEGDLKWKMYGLLIGLSFVMLGYEELVCKMLLRRIAKKRDKKLYL